jgi:hypothetical protein
MTALTLELRAYKERTLQQLLANYSLLEERLEKESRSDIAADIRSQLDDIKAHLTLLRQELATNMAGEPVANELYRRAATALTTHKFFLARKLIHKLETIEPFYPDIDRLKSEADAGRASRRTQSISKGGALPELIVPPPGPEAESGPTPPTDEVVDSLGLEPERQGWRRLFQFHILASCLVVSAIFCVMAGIGGVTALQWLFAGN